MKKLKELSMFFPAYNEVENIPQLVKSATKVCRQSAKKYEIILVIHANSSDGSIALARKLARKDRHVRLVIQPRSDPGVGAAIRLGFHAARYENIFYADSDNQFDLSDFRKFLPFVGKYDIIAGYRMKRRDPGSRIFTSSVYNAIVKSLFLVPERDVDCAFRLVRKSVIDRIRLSCRYGLATTEILAKARRRGFRIRQIGVGHYPRTLGKPVFEMDVGLNLPKPKVVIELAAEMAKLFYEIYMKRDY
jgi:glycosyltransferase involved in cell wall biosynthesis